MSRTSLNAAVATAALLFAVGGCTSDSTDAAADAAAIDSPPAQADGGPAAMPRQAGRGNGELPDGFPDDFPMPPDLVVQHGQFTEGSFSTQANFQVRGTSPDSVSQVWGFYNDRLPEAGYEIQRFQPLDAGAEHAVVYFDGERFRDSSVQLASTDGGTSVLISLPVRD